MRRLVHASLMALAIMVLAPLSEGAAYGQGFPGRRDGRLALAGLVGPVEHLTEVADLHLPEVIPRSDPAEGVAPRVVTPEQLTPIKIDPHSEGEPFYVKLRAEVDKALLASGSGQMYLGFHLDPIHHVHWNNLVAGSV